MEKRTKCGEQRALHRNLRRQISVRTWLYDARRAHPRSSLRKTQDIGKPLGEHFPIDKHAVTQKATASFLAARGYHHVLHDRTNKTPLGYTRTSRVNRAAAALCIWGNAGGYMQLSWPGARKLGRRETQRDT